MATFCLQKRLDSITFTGEIVINYWSSKLVSLTGSFLCPRQSALPSAITTVHVCTRLVQMKMNMRLLPRVSLID